MLLSGLLVLAGATRVLAQSSDAKEIRVAVGGFLKESFFTRLNMYRNQRVLLDTTRLAKVFEGGESILVERRQAAPQRGLEMRDLATAAGVAIAGKEDLIRCKQVAFDCSPAGVAILQVGDPAVKGDSAFVVYLITTTPNGERRLTQQVMTLHRFADGWHPTMLRDARQDRPGTVLPVPGLFAH